MRLDFAAPVDVDAIAILAGGVTPVVALLSRVVSGFSQPTPSSVVLTTTEGPIVVPPPEDHCEYERPPVVFVDAASGVAYAAFDIPLFFAL